MDLWPNLDHLETRGLLHLASKSSNANILAFIQLIMWIHVTRDDKLVRGVSTIWFLLLDLSCRVLGSRTTCCDIRLLRTADIVTLDEGFVDSVERLRPCPLIRGSGRGYYFYRNNSVCRNEERYRWFTFLGRPTLFFVGGLEGSCSVCTLRSCIVLPTVCKASALFTVEKAHNNWKKLVLAHTI